MKKYDTRTILAFVITLAAMIGITALAWVIIVNGTTDAAAQGVFNAVLPLFGTWVGTVLAYYFSRDNFEAATDSTERIIRQLTPEEKLRSIPVVDVMVKDITFVSDRTTSANKWRKDLNKKGIKRLPILDESRVFQALLYVDDIQTYLLDNVEVEDRASKTIDDILKLEKPNLKRVPAFVGPKATLAAARNEMERVDQCKVVFITEDGSKSTPVMGMVTNSDIARHARM